jgi:pimeloyl-ACP methyl ester carboxylesterase
MCGGGSRAALKEMVKEVREAIGGADMKEFAGHKHHAMTTAPELFVAELAEFFGDHL